MLISLIAAMDRDRVIGNKNQLPWHLPADLAHFKKLTRGKPVVMGRKTYESIGKPLPDRVNIILTRDKGFQVDGCVVVHTIDEARVAAGDADEIMVIGGEKIFEQFLPIAGRMYLTFVDAEVAGDVKFPEWNKDEWREAAREEHPADEKNKYSCAFVTLNRVW